MADVSCLAPSADYLWLLVLLAIIIPLPVTLRDELDREGDIPGEWN